MHTYEMTKELKEKAFRINSRSTKKAIVIEVAFINEKILKKEHFLAKKHCVLDDFCVHFENSFRWECAYVCHH